MSEIDQIEDSALRQVRGLRPLIQVFDIPESVHFYCDRLGFELVSRSEERDTPEGPTFHWAWLRLRGADLMLNTAYDESERLSKRDPERQAAHRDTGLFFGCPNVEGAAAELREAGIAIAGPKTAPCEIRQLWLTDPDGNQLCLQASA